MEWVLIGALAAPFVAVAIWVTIAGIAHLIVGALDFAEYAESPSDWLYAALDGLWGFAKGTIGVALVLAAYGAVGVVIGALILAFGD